jgi:hypothetical protein
MKILVRLFLFAAFCSCSVICELPEGKYFNQNTHESRTS